MTAATDTEPDRSDAEQAELVAIRRNTLLSAAIGFLAALIGIAFLLRADWVLDRPLGALLLALAAVHLLALLSARTPVLVADDQGIRMRLGLSWRGLPWSSIRQVVIERADSPLREGRLVIAPRDPVAIASGIGLIGRAHVAWNRFWYDSALSVPLGMATYADTPDLVGDLRALSAGVDIAELRGPKLANLPEDRPGAEPGTDEAEHLSPVPAATAPVTALPPSPEEDAAGSVIDIEAAGELPPPPEDEEDFLPPPVSPLRSLRPTVRAEVALEPAPGEPAAGDQVMTWEHDEESSGAEPELDLPAQRRPEEIAALLAGVELHAASPEPQELILGQKISRAREMLDMSIEELSQRTRIRPHVLEAMELDDFRPCGGDVYARGHLASVARVLGLSADSLVTLFDEHFSQGEINPRRVFEAELSHGLSGGMRTTFGGPRWSLLIGTVLCLTMVWGLARMFAGDPEQLSVAPEGSVAVQSANRKPITSPLMKTTSMRVTASHAPARVVVRDRTGKVLWSGELPLGGQRRVVGLAPFKVRADNGGAVEVTVRGQALGTVGTAGEAAAKRFG